MTGEFGNHSPTWDGISQLYVDYPYIPSDKLFHIRNRVAGGFTIYNIPGNRLPAAWQSLLQQGEDVRNFYISEMAPTEKTVFQGEVYRSVKGLGLFYSCQPRTMRESLALDGKQVYGITSLSLLKHFMDNASLEWLWDLMDWYPDHVVEFSVYSKCWGTIPNRNTVFWEVRRY